MIAFELNVSHLRSYMLYDLLLPEMGDMYYNIVNNWLYYSRPLYCNKVNINILPHQLYYKQVWLLARVNNDDRSGLHACGSPLGINTTTIHRVCVCRGVCVFLGPPSMVQLLRTHIFLEIAVSHRICLLLIRFTYPTVLCVYFPGEYSTHHSCYITWDNYS